jgi:2-phosphosulfolactate phosphatase
MTDIDRSFHVDVALYPAAATVAAGRVVVVVDQIRASTTITTALDLGCSDLLLAGDVSTARRLRDGSNRLLAGEQQALKPPDFDFDNSPSELTRADIHGRSLVLCTTNGTAVVSRLRDADHLLIGCLRNAGSVASAALDLAGVGGRRGDILVVCAGREGRFVLDDAVAAGVIVGRIVERARTTGREVALTDAAQAAIRIRASFPDLLAAMTVSDGGLTLRSIGRADDIDFCAEEDASETVPALAPGLDLRIVALSLAPFGGGGS